MSQDAYRGILPRNLTARAAHRVAGNSVVTRPEDAVANCYPGLELDVRNLDRRFFPGLVFDYVARHDISSDYTEPQRYGALLRYVDAYDPDLRLDTPLAGQLSADLGNVADVLGAGTWYLDWLEQHGKRIVLYRHSEDGSELPLDGLYVWRIVRSLEPLQRLPAPAASAMVPEAAGSTNGGAALAPLRIGLRQRDATGGSRVVELHGWRRRFSDPITGVLSSAYEPGELQMSMCSPWQHDFRDCQCHYWAANRPDVVFGEVLPGDPMLPDGSPADPRRADTLLDWMRADRDRSLAAAASDLIEQNRPYQYDHFQINHTWQDLGIVLDNTEVGNTYVPPSEAQATPFRDASELADVLRTRMAPAELLVALEYLYALFSVKQPEEVTGTEWPTLQADVVFIRQHLLLIATSEMQHLRWANTLLWELYDAGLVTSPSAPSYAPVLSPAEWIVAPAFAESASPTSPGTPSALPGTTSTLARSSPPNTPLPPGWRWRRRALRPLRKAVLDDLIAIEHPAGDIDRTYARVVSTLRQPGYPPHLVERAERILRDGGDHFNRLRDMRGIVKTNYWDGEQEPDDLPYLRRVQAGTPVQAREALSEYQIIINSLAQAYQDQMQGDFAQSNKWILKARQAMDALRVTGDDLAQRGIGIPFWSDQ